MSNRKMKKLKWTAVEEAALVAGVKKHGIGKWSKILLDPEFKSTLENRSNIDLKDKWRNITVSVTGERSKSSRAIRRASRSSAADNVISGSAPRLLTAPAEDTGTDAVLLDSAKEPPESQSGSEILSMIFDALKASNSSKGSDIETIVRYIEERYEAPPNLKKVLAQRLRRLVEQGKLDKVNQLYTIKQDYVTGAKGASLNQKKSKPHNSQSQVSPCLPRSLTEPAEAAAYEIAAAEKSSLVAKEALEELKRVSKMAEESYSLLEIAQDIHERCSRGEVVFMNLKSDEE